jgi:RND family efflux transporter MFP subunit
MFSNQNSRRPPIRRGSLLAGVALSLLSIAATGCGKSGEAATKEAEKAKVAPRTVTVTVAPIEVRPVKRTISVVGTLHGLETVQLSSKVSGRIEKVNVDIGDRVAPGSVLAEIDQTDYRLAVDEAQRALERELAKLGLNEVPTERFDAETLPSIVRGRLLVANAKRQYERLRELVGRNASSIQEYEQAETTLRVEEASLRQVMLDVRATMASIRYAQSVLATAQRQLTETHVLAPPLAVFTNVNLGDASYVVSRRHVAAGEFATGIGAPMFELVVDDVLKLKATVPERYAAEVKVGQPVELHVEAYPNDTFQAVVARISPTIDPQSRTFELEAHVPNADHRLQHGGFAKASVVTRQAADAVTAPIESVINFAGVTKLFTVVGGKAQEVPIQTGLRGDGWVEVVGQIDPEAVVVTSGQSQLANGTAVTLRQSTTAAAQTARLENK